MKSRRGSTSSKNTDTMKDVRFKTNSTGFGVTGSAVGSVVDPMDVNKAKRTEAEEKERKA